MNQINCTTCNNIEKHNFSKAKLNYELKNVLKHKPYTILFKPTHNCNIHCEYCYDRVAQKKHGKNIMSTDRAKKVINMIAADPRSCAAFTFHGGEPLLAGIEWYQEVLPYIKNKVPDMELSIQTNGTLLNEAFLDLFKKYNVLIGLSYDIYPDNLPTKLKYRKNISIKKLKELIEYDRCSKPHLLGGFISVISNVNYKNLKKSFIKGLEELNLSPSFNFLFPTNEICLGENIFYSYEDYAEELKQFLFYFVQAVENENIERNITHLTSKLHGGDYSCCNRLDCSYGWVGIGPNGELAHCDSYTYGKYYLGTIDDYEHITDMHYTENYNNIIQDKVKKRLTNCNRCPLSDICKGTCFANSLSEKHDDITFDSNACNELYYSLFGLYQIYRNYNVFLYVKPNTPNLVQKQLVLSDYYTMWEINEVFKSELNIDLYTLEKNVLDSPHALFKSKEYQIFRLFNPSEFKDSIWEEKRESDRVITYNLSREFSKFVPNTKEAKSFSFLVNDTETIIKKRKMSIKYALIRNLEKIQNIINK